MDATQRSATARILTEELAAAKSRYAAASNRFHSLMREIPSGLPYPDGVLRIHQASKEAHESLDAYVRALKRFTDFTVHRIIPSDLDAPTRPEGSA